MRRGYAQLHPRTADRIGLAAGDTILLHQYGPSWPFRVERNVGVELGHVRLNEAEVDDIGILPGLVLTAGRVPLEAALPTWSTGSGRHDWLVPMDRS